jgi:carbonic anhydrase/acetyltransferase-like protein (isoleucine patch superfamily)
MAVYEVQGMQPRIDASAWVADSAEVMGEVQIGPLASIWFGCAVRGDTDCIRIGEGSNIQDLSVLHADHGSPLSIGRHVTVGHRVILHGCTVGDETMIGMGAVVLNGARIGKRCLVGAGALVTQGKSFPDGSMILGAPARVVRQLGPEQLEWVSQSAQHYIDRARVFRTTLKKL